MVAESEVTSKSSTLSRLKGEVIYVGERSAMRIARIRYPDGKNGKEQQASALSTHKAANEAFFGVPSPDQKKNPFAHRSTLYETHPKWTDDWIVGSDPKCSVGLVQAHAKGCPSLRLEKTA